MKRIWGRVVSIVVAGLAAAVVSPACATNDSSIFIRTALAPPAARTNGACTYTADPQQPGLLRGTFDLGVADAYTGTLLVGSQLIARGDPSGARAESNRIHLNGVIVSVQEPDGRVLNEFTSFATGFADFAQAGSPSFGTVTAPMIDAKTRDILLQQNLVPSTPARSVTHTVLVNVKAFGRTLGGVDVESGTYAFPVSVCNGCTVDFSSGNDPAVQPQPNCLKALDSGATRPCSAGSDEPTPCQVCRGRDACDPLKNK